MNNDKELYNYAPILTNFRENMKTERIKKKLTQKQLADMVGVDKRTILNYENNKTIPQPNIMDSIAVALDTSLEELIGDNDDNRKRIKIAEFLEEMDTNPLYERAIEEEILTQSILEKVEFIKKVNENNITDEELDEIIGGSSDFSRDKKIQIALLIYNDNIKINLVNLENFYLANDNNFIINFY